MIPHDLDAFKRAPWANETTNPPPDVCSVCSDVIRDDAETATDGRGEPIHADCETCDCCGHTVGTCRIVCDLADSEREGK